MCSEGVLSQTSFSSLSVLHVFSSLNTLTAGSRLRIRLCQISLSGKLGKGLLTMNRFLLFS